MALRCRSLSRVFIFELSFCMPGNEHWYILGFRDHLPLNATSWVPSIAGVTRRLLCIRHARAAATSRTFATDL